MSIEVNNESGVALDEERLVALARATLDRLRIHPLAELSVAVVDERAMEDLHVRFMDLPGPTDVMSFPMDELRAPRDDEEPEPGLLGDIVLCPTVAERQAAEAGHSTADELDLLLVHGILHLLGHDHAEPEEHAVMFGLQGKLLDAWRSDRRRGAGTL
ncbi:putative rRNA maturation factor [Motilibacter rhizosphaerae]|uniref:Endoribonuclease YbeY n=1 Tax=Motilibacter rhizosphaerae TaxID=598652 RepID=A0A4V2F4L4_9ACTN|nr:rRNA maturation RNase YbeY [Motilibacter rhizosphaerae]RZS89729.1 putative rRNA maturation factor [Motilibacter rhizosphaerae]